jgi:hypothetical protein
MLLELHFAQMISEYSTTVFPKKEEQSVKYVRKKRPPL